MNIHSNTPTPQAMSPPLSIAMLLLPEHCLGNSALPAKIFDPRQLPFCAPDSDAFEEMLANVSLRHGGINE